LGQVGTVIFTVTQLQQSLLVDLAITASCGGIDAHTGRRQIVDAQQLSHQFLLKGLPMDIIGEQPQHICQPIIGHILRAQGLHPACAQGFQPSARPLLHLIHAMIGLRKNMGQPHHAQFTHTQSFPLTVGRDVFVQQFGHFHALHVGHQQWDVIHPFCLDAQGFFHAFSLSESSDCVQI
jgi:hypothetical protein